MAKSEFYNKFYLKYEKLNFGVVELLLDFDIVFPTYQF